MSFSHWTNYVGWAFLVIIKGLEAVFPAYKTGLDDLLLFLAGAGFHINMEGK